MPYVLRPPIRKARFAIGVVAASFAFAALPAIASADCPDQPSSQIFSIYGDNEYYTEVPNGDFDTSTSGWYVDNAKPDGADSLARKNAPHLTSDGKSLRLDKQGYAVSPEVCVSERHPSFRFFAYKKGGGTGDLDVSLYYTTSDGNHGIVSVGDLASDLFQNWKLSPSLPLWQALPLQGNESAQVRLVFDYGFLPNGDPQPGVKNQWRIDEVYVDPYRR